MAGIDGPDHVLFVEYGLVEVPMDLLPAFEEPRDVGGPDGLDGQDVEDLLGPLGDVAVAEEPEDDGTQLAGRPLPDELPCQLADGLLGFDEALVAVGRMEDREGVGRPFGLEPLAEGPERIDHPRVSGIVAEIEDPPAPFHRPSFRSR